MKKYFSLLIVALAIFAHSPAQATTCDIKAVKDPEDGSIFYNPDHRLHKYVKLNKGKGDKTFCSETQAKKEGYRNAPSNFSNSTARLIECVEKGVGKCVNYVVGQYRSLDIYDKVCAPSNLSNGRIISDFMKHAKADKKNMDVAKFYGTTGALMEAYPCKGGKVAAR